MSVRVRIGEDRTVSDTGFAPRSVTIGSFETVQPGPVPLYSSHYGCGVNRILSGSRGGVAVIRSMIVTQGANLLPRSGGKPKR